MKALLVDDSLTEQLIITRYLKDMDHEVTVASNGPDALAKIKASQPDVILLDVVMPGMSGLEVAKTIRNTYQDWIPIIFLSAMDNPKDIHDGIVAGGDDYIAKPADKVILSSKMKAMERIALMRAELIETQEKLELANQALAIQASQDGLTGVANRREFDAQLRRELFRCQREGYPLGLLMCDIDYFKHYNDTYGHLAGDDCIIIIAQLLVKNLIRSSDLVARYGGEEFAILLPNIDESGLINLAERLNQQVNGADIEHRNSKIANHVTLSIGGICATELDTVTPAQIIELADQALYQAKRSGRNTFVIHQQQACNNNPLIDTELATPQERLEAGLNDAF